MLRAKTLTCIIEMQSQVKKFLLKKFLSRISNGNAKKILMRINELSHNPICEKRLKGKLKKFCRARIGGYRIIYMLMKCRVIVVRVGRRKSIYDRLK